ncbi:hypothetical protein Tco_0910820 [Tanacetum coccineum]|uniref:Uncharacterized protein n=1 Tax=Tanacetum coccineum TaxID=301880 RepID=A0ABQ5CU08_9ASTR
MVCRTMVFPIRLVCRTDEVHPALLRSHADESAYCLLSVLSEFNNTHVSANITHLQICGMCCSSCFELAGLDVYTRTCSNGMISPFCLVHGNHDFVVEMNAHGTTYFVLGARGAKGLEVCCNQTSLHEAIGPSWNWLVIRKRQLRHGVLNQKVGQNDHKTIFEDSRLLQHTFHTEGQLDFHLRQSSSNGHSGLHCS